jgi:hypothetical protein
MTTAMAEMRGNSSKVLSCINTVPLALTNLQLREKRSNMGPPPGIFVNLAFGKFYTKLILNHLREARQYCHGASSAFFHSSIRRRFTGIPFMKERDHRRAVAGAATRQLRLG